MEWQTIETAPMDGTEVLAAWFAEWWGWQMDVCRYDASDGSWRSNVTRKATHWMPLPPAPEGKS